MPPVQSTNTVIVLSELTARQRLVLSTDDTSALSSSSSSMLSVLSALANTCTQPLSKRERQLNLLLCRLEPRGRRELTGPRDGEKN